MASSGTDYTGSFILFPIYFYVRHASPRPQVIYLVACSKINLFALGCSTA